VLYREAIYGDTVLAFYKKAAETQAKDNADS